MTPTQIKTSRPDGDGERRVAIDCTGCKAHCCRREVVALVKGDRIKDYPEAIEFNTAGKMHLAAILPTALGWVIPHGDDGACIYLKNERCSIYEKRPIMCRVFSCVGWVERILATTARAERRRDKALIDTAVWREGQKRREPAIAKAEFR